MKDNPFYTSLVEHMAPIALPEPIKASILNEQFIAENPAYYLKYPALFCQAFGIREEEIYKLSVAGFLYYKSILSTDTLVDSVEKIKNPLAIIVMQQCQEECIKILTDIFGAYTTFWNFWNRRKTEYVRAMQMEKEFADKVSVAAYEKVADYKSSFGKVALDALHLLSGKRHKSIYEDLLASHRLFSIGFQLCDDIKDLKEDYLLGQFNWAMQCTNQHLQDKADSYDIDLKNKVLYVEGVAMEIYKDVLTYYNDALALAEKTDAKVWKTTLKKAISEIQNTIRTIHQYLTIIKTKVALETTPASIKAIQLSVPKVKPSIQEIYEHAITAISEEWSKEYGELKHVMFLGKEEGFMAEKEVHIGDVFQRAIITDILIDVNKSHFDPALQNLINQEINYLLDKELDAGGWSYFPSVPEIAPDADDLGQMIQCLSRSERWEAIEKRCQPLIDTLLEDNMTEMGVSETWIIPNTKRSKVQERQLYFNKTKWGCGPDTEVVANFIYGLSLVNKLKYQTHIENACNWLSAQQHADGYWESRWYYGNFYGTYTCLRLFAENNLNPGAISKAVDYVLSVQNMDGGWGLSEKSDPLNTALAILCLHQSVQKNEIAIEHGLQFLKENKHPETKRWEAVPFIRPKAGQPYKSTTITTAYVLKAVTAML